MCVVRPEEDKELGYKDLSHSQLANKKQRRKLAPITDQNKRSVVGKRGVDNLP